MTQHPHPSTFNASGTRRARARGGFTLIELLVVMGVILVLLGVGLPMLSRTMKQAKKTRAAADLQAIEGGLTAYRTDFGDYPRPDESYTGFALLGRALISPGPAGGFPPPSLTMPVGAGTVTSVGTPGSAGYAEYVAIGRPDPSGGFTTSATPPHAEWANFPVSDGKDGPGFRGRVGGGQSFGPYLQPDKFRTQGLAILDLWDNPVLYFPGRPKKPAPNASGEWALLPLTAAAGPNAQYNFFQNASFFMRPGDNDLTNARNRMEAVVVKPGNNNFNGVMETGEQAAADKPYLLWSAGADGNFGPTYNTAANPTAEDIKKVDDVTNFTTGQ